MEKDKFSPSVLFAVILVSLFGLAKAVAEVTECPLSHGSWEERSENVSCAEGYWYHCLRSWDDDRIMEECLPIYQLDGREGCPVLTRIGKRFTIKQVPCNGQTDGLPCEHGGEFSSNSVYDYPLCLTLSISELTGESVKSHRETTENGKTKDIDQDGTVAPTDHLRSTLLQSLSSKATLEFQIIKTRQRIDKKKGLKEIPYSSTTIAVAEVTECPLSHGSWEERSENVSCAEGYWYHCLRSWDDDRIMEECLPIYQLDGREGCPVLTRIGKRFTIKQVPCNGQTEGLPCEHGGEFSSNSLYDYPLCLTLSISELTGESVKSHRETTENGKTKDIDQDGTVAPTDHLRSTLLQTLSSKATLGSKITKTRQRIGKKKGLKEIPYSSIYAIKRRAPFVVTSIATETTVSTATETAISYSTASSLGVGLSLLTLAVIPGAIYVGYWKRQTYDVEKIQIMSSKQTRNKRPKRGVRKIHVIPCRRTKFSIFHIYRDEQRYDGIEGITNRAYSQDHNQEDDPEHGKEAKGTNDHTISYRIHRQGDDKNRTFHREVRETDSMSWEYLNPTVKYTDTGNAIEMFAVARNLKV